MLSFSPVFVPRLGEKGKMSWRPAGRRQIAFRQRGIQDCFAIVQTQPSGFVKQVP